MAASKRTHCPIVLSHSLKYSVEYELNNNSCFGTVLCSIAQHCESMNCCLLSRFKLARERDNIAGVTQSYLTAVESCQSDVAPGFCIVPENLLASLLVVIFTGTVIHLVWCVCTWTDLWRMAPLKTDQVMDEKLEASGFIPGWCMSHMMVSGANTKQLAAFHPELLYKALLKGLSMTCLTFICVPDQIASHSESMSHFLDCMVPPPKHFYQIFRQTQWDGTESACNAEKNLGSKPTRWGGSGISVSRLRCQDASTGMQVLTCDATPDDLGSAFGAKRKIIDTENPHFHMNACQWECMAQSKRFPLTVGGGGGRHSVHTTKCCLYGGERTSWCVCSALIKRGARRNSGNKREAYGKVDRVFLS